jgi:hypothetical protein
VPQLDPPEPESAGTGDQTPGWRHSPARVRDPSGKEPRRRAGSLSMDLRFPTAPHGTTVHPFPGDADPPAFRKRLVNGPGPHVGKGIS